MSKQPKPKGKGNYVYCSECKGNGFTLNPKKYEGKKIWAPKKTINLALTCKLCKGAGWTDQK